MISPAGRWAPAARGRLPRRAAAAGTRLRQAGGAGSALHSNQRGHGGLARKPSRPEARRDLPCQSPQRRTIRVLLALFQQPGDATFHRCLGGSVQLVTPLPVLQGGRATTRAVRVRHRGGGRPPRTARLRCATDPPASGLQARRCWRELSDSAKQQWQQPPSRELSTTGSSHLQVCGRRVDRLLEKEVQPAGRQLGRGQRRHKALGFK